MRYRVQVSYDGSGFAGWQRQSEASPDLRPSIQASIEAALEKVLSQFVRIQASGRTDAGTHARCQFFHFDIDEADKEAQSKVENVYRFLRSLNALTPTAIGLRKVWQAPQDFHALHSAQHKTYKYYIHNATTPDPLDYNHTYWIRHKLDLEVLNGLSEVLLGQKDFKSFQTRGTELKTTVREITQAQWTQEGEKVIFSITGTGFLKQMVRNIVGTMVFLHDNQGNPMDVQTILAACDRQAAGPTAPAQGLFLEGVEYPSELDKRCREL